MPLRGQPGLLWSRLTATTASTVTFLGSAMVLVADAIALVLHESDIGVTGRLRLGLVFICAIVAVVWGTHPGASTARDARARAGRRWFRIAAGIAGGVFALGVVSDAGGGYDVVSRLGNYVDSRQHPVDPVAADRNNAYLTLAALRPDAPRPALIASLGQPSTTGRSTTGLLQDLWLIEVDGRASAVVLARTAPDGTGRLLAISTLRRDFTPRLPVFWWPSGTPFVLGQTKLAEVPKDTARSFGYRYADDYGWFYDLRGPYHGNGFRYEMWGFQDWDCQGQYPFPDLTFSAIDALKVDHATDLPDERPSRDTGRTPTATEVDQGRQDLDRMRESAPVTTVALTASEADVTKTGFPVLLRADTEGLFRTPCP
jgi:hypothetical protein